MLLNAAGKKGTHLDPSRFDQPTRRRRESRKRPFAHVRSVRAKPSDGARMCRVVPFIREEGQEDG